MASFNGKKASIEVGLLQPAYQCFFQDAVAVLKYSIQDGLYSRHWQINKKEAVRTVRNKGLRYNIHQEKKGYRAAP
jgi:hypothetical protein